MIVAMYIHISFVFYFKRPTPRLWRYLRESMWYAP